MVNRLLIRLLMTLVLCTTVAVVATPNVLAQNPPIVDPDAIDPDRKTSNNVDTVFEAFFGVQMVFGLVAGGWCVYDFVKPNRSIIPGILALVASVANAGFGVAAMSGEAPGNQKSNRVLGAMSVALGAVNIGLGITQILLTNRPRRQVLTLSPSVVPDGHGGVNAYLTLQGKF